MLGLVGLGIKRREAELISFSPPNGHVLLLRSPRSGFSSSKTSRSPPPILSVDIGHSTIFLSSSSSSSSSFGRSFHRRELQGPFRSFLVLLFLLYSDPLDFLLAFLLYSLVVPLEVSEEAWSDSC